MRGITWADPEGRQGVRTPPPGKSQVICVSIGKKQLDPLGKNLTPSPGKCSNTTGTLANNSFHWTSVKYVEDKKKIKKTLSEFFYVPGGP